MSFIISHHDKQTKARAGQIETAHGSITTPVFMPVGTQATVKAVPTNQLEEYIDPEIILTNTYHLYLRPGVEVINKAGGVHRFMNWKKPMLTDSGGYQVYSLNNMRKISEEGVSFASHIDGSKHLFTPEFAIDIQRNLGADIIMAFDECTPYPCDRKYAENSMHLTHRWLDRCISRFNETPNLYGYDQILAPIVQGSTYEDLRKQSAEFIASRNMPINAIGGLSVGEPHEYMYGMTDVVTDILPKDKPRYLMGVGLPENLLESIALGIDMFDCVLPTRNARHGLLYTNEGIINIKNAKWKDDLDAIDKNSASIYSRDYSKAYLHHLFRVREHFGSTIASMHNLSFFVNLVKEAREHIIKGDFRAWKDQKVKELVVRL